MAAPYPCSPIDLRTSSFRLFSFSIKDDGSIHGILQEFPLAQHPPFIALSYTWGLADVLHDADIHVNGGKVKIQENLRVALLAIWDHQNRQSPYETHVSEENLTPRRSLMVALRRKRPRQKQQNSCEHVKEAQGRSAHKAARADTQVALPEAHRLEDTQFMQKPRQWVHFWIDAICIDQTNVLERNHQVQNMKQIYEVADFVLVWLGAASVDSSTAMQYFISGCRQCKPDDTITNAIRGLLCRAYWSRVWIVQESILAKEILIGCGQQFVDFDQDFRPYITRHFHFAPEPSIAAAFSIAFQRSILSGYTWPKDHGYLDWPNIIQSYFRQQCSDPRDRIFAFLGLLLAEEGSKPFQADYRLSATKLFDRVMTHAILCSNFAVIGILESEGKSLWFDFGEKLEAALEVDCGYGKMFGGKQRFMEVEFERLGIVETKYPKGVIAQVYVKYHLAETKGEHNDFRKGIN